MLRRAFAIALLVIIAACSSAGSGFSATGAGAPPLVKIGTSTAGFSLLHSFQVGPDGGDPLSDLRVINGVPYGTTTVGGTGGRVCSCGTVFFISGSGEERVVSRFKGTYSRTLGKIGDDGARPEGGLLSYNGSLYGTTYAGGETGLSSGCSAQVNSGCGTVYRIDQNGKRTTLYRFLGGSDGRGAVGDLVALNGKFYGTTSQGGSCDCGTIFSIDPSGNERPIYLFKGYSDGGNPQIGLTLVGRRLYGTAFGTISSCGCGSVFSTSPSGAFTLIHLFEGGSDGANPQSNLVNVKGTLYGTVTNGVRSACPPLGCGGIFSIDPFGHEAIVYAFGSVANDGAHPSGSLAVVNGIIYGTTQVGGSYGCRFQRGCGTIFRFDPKTGVEAPAFAFTSADGAEPVGITAANGVLYGMTNDAGGHRAGTAYAYVP